MSGSTANPARHVGAGLGVGYNMGLMRSPRALLAVLGFASAALASAQPATPEQRAGVQPDPNFATLHLTTKLGSFKLLDGVGRVEISFTGSLLLSKIDGRVLTSGKLRKEFESKDRVVYSGTGKVVVTGRWRGIQWFGRDMNAVWFGAGQARLAGEFDKNLETGKYWYDDPEQKFDWMASGTTTIGLPNRYLQPAVKPIERGQLPKKKG